MELHIYLSTSSWRRRSGDVALPLLASDASVAFVFIAPSELVPDAISIMTFNATSLSSAGFVVEPHRLTPMLRNQEWSHVTPFDYYRRLLQMMEVMMGRTQCAHRSLRQILMSMGRRFRLRRRAVRAGVTFKEMGV